ncbi:MAG TPA: nuclear transport factor 2 family protein [Jiangellales bacterium]|nr:nuclear transport factor 2 family protein [Jiangellales bacterium]
MDDKDAVVGTVKDYFEGWFDGDAERMERALHPALAATAQVPGRVSAR